MVRVMRIELTYRAWEARVLPLNYTRIADAGDSSPKRGGKQSKRDEIPENRRLPAQNSALFFLKKPLPAFSIDC
jgi:hypothetical protein